MDPITLEVINNRLREIVATMEHLLFHSGYSTILRESFDGSAGLCDAEGRAVMALGAPYHLFPYHYSVEGVLRAHPVEEMEDGDSFVLTDPYWGGNLHVPDLVVVTPIFVDGSVIGFTVSIAHKTDVGGLVPGSSGAAAREIFHDGILLPAIRYWTRNGVVKDAELIVKRNSRSPDTVAGDIRAQVGCTRVGAERVVGLCDEYGVDTMVQAFAELQRLSELRVRRQLAEWPDGHSEAEAWVDHDGVDVDVPLRLHVAITKAGDEITFDYSGMPPQGKGAMNLRPPHAETAALLALLTYLDPTIPINDGAGQPLRFVNPEGTITNAQWPAAVNSYYGLTTVLYSAIQKALVRFNPDRAVGTVGFGTGAIAIGYRSAGKQLIQYEINTNSLGGTPEHDGTFPVMPMSHVTPYTPVEILESEFPVRVLRHEWIADTAGAGLYRGGPGARKEYQVLTDALFTLRAGHQFVYPGWGVLGGKGAPPARAFLNRGTDRERALGPLETLALQSGDTVTLETPGGGGYGDPRHRAPDVVRDDVLNGYVSPDGARADYGVVLDPDTLEVDQAATTALRDGD